MTKHIRVENADTNTYYRPIVETWEKGRDGEPDTLIGTEALAHPTMMVTGMIHSTRYLVIREATPADSIGVDATRVG